jgi:hypothetical protein
MFLRSEAVQAEQTTRGRSWGRRLFLTLLFVLLIAMVIFGYSPGWLKHEAGKASELFATAIASVEHLVDKGSRYAATVFKPSMQATTIRQGDSNIATSPSSDNFPIAGFDVAAAQPQAVPATRGGEEALGVARGAYAAGDINGAVEGYRAYIASNPDSVAAHGELGNIFYGMGMTSVAAQAYFTAASIAIEQDQVNVAESLLPAVIEGNPMLASLLNDRLFEAQIRTDRSHPWPPVFQPVR